MDAGNQLYFGPFNAEAQKILSTVLPAQHLLAASGNAEAPREAPKMKRTKSGRLTKSASSTLSLGTTNIRDQVKSKKRAGDNTSLPFGKAVGVYIKAGGILVFLISFFFFVTAQSSRQASDYSVRWWTGDGQGWYKNNNSPFGIPAGNSYALLYGILTIAFIVLMLFRGAFYHLWSLGASQRLHSAMTHNVLHAPLGFFLRNPVGDMLVAFSKDQDIMDENLVDCLHYLGIYGFILLSTAVTVSIVIPTFAAFAAALVIVAVSALAFYLPAATALKKHRAETAGDLVGLVAETLEGLPVINAFAQRQYFLDTAEHRIDTHHKAIYNAESLSLWLAFYCDLFGAILVLAVCCFSMAQRQTLGASAVGLAFSNVIQLLVFFSWSIRNVADGLSYMGSTEKIGWLAKGPVPQEGGAVTGPDGQSLLIEDSAAGGKGGKTAGDAGKLIVSVAAGGEGVDEGGAPVPEGWPRTGVVEFCDVWMRYAPTAPFALKGVTFRLEHGEKVGVVGRTGSGKSTLLLALYRMFVLDKGHCKVDGIDTGTLSLRRLRPALSIIPQEPVVFSGTVRSNLDPWGETSDSQMWDVLRQVGLEGAAKSAGGLDGRLDGTGGQAWSLGQQQLMCLARAALKRSPVLCLDEATAAMDPHTEQQVTAVIKRIFSDRTTITIAHRLDTVIEGDKIIVMEQGVLQEFAAPHVLLGDKESMFSKLVDKSGAQAAAALRAVAAEYFASKGTVARA
jgi:ABC-type multidrug transport system fused ATPase/permease subunit